MGADVLRKERQSPRAKALDSFLLVTPRIVCRWNPTLTFGSDVSHSSPKSMEGTPSSEKTGKGSPPSLLGLMSLVPPPRVWRTPSPETPEKGRQPASRKCDPRNTKSCHVFVYISYPPSLLTLSFLFVESHRRDGRP